MLEVPKNLPDTLLRYYDDLLQEAHGGLKHTTLSEVRERMSVVQHTSTERTSGYVELLPSGDYDEKHAVVMPLPFTQGWNTSIGIRALLLSDVLPEQRVIVFPQNTARERVYALDRKERASVAMGRFTPIAERHLRTLDALNVKSINVIGYSGGAAVGSALLQSALRSGLEIGNSGLFEPPNVMPRKFRRICKDFTAEGMRPVYEAIAESGIPVLIECRSQHAVRRVASRALYLASIMQAENRALARGFAYPTFESTVTEVLEGNTGARILFACGANSRIVPHEVEYKLRNGLGRRQDFNVLALRGRGHEMGDAVVVHTMLARMALDGIEVLPYDTLP